jgi:hypothetical protein
VIDYKIVVDDRWDVLSGARAVELTRARPPLNLLNTAAVLFFNLRYASGFSCGKLFPGMISIATKRITTTTSMSITSTKAKKTISASGAWRNS